MSENEEFIREFLEECAESLDQLDKDLVALETDPHNARLLDNIFRTIHTIKGTSGFFGFSKLGAVAHDGESLLGRLRDGELVLTQEIATALLKLVDAIRTILANVGDSGGEGTGDFQGLSAELIRLALSPGVQAMLEPTTTVAAVTAPAADVPPSEPVETEPSADVSPSHGEPPATLPPTTESDSEALPALSPAPDVSVVTSDKAPSPVDRGAPPRLATRDAAPVTTSEGSIRVDVGLLDELVDLAGELVLARNQLNQLGAASDNRALLNTIQKLNLITSELQEGVMQARMQPIATIWGKFPRLVRDLAVGCQKEVRLEQFGEDTELDRSLLEAIRDPLTHLIRNAVDHGIEPPHVRESRGKPRPGRVLLRAYHESGQVHLEITDDGGGIDLQRIRQRALDHDLISAQQADAMSDQELSQLIFLPGFSTAEKVTAVSGRGVGMDVVRTNIERIGGSIELQNRPGLGTTVRITIPLTLAIIPALIVICQGESFAIPEVAVTELLSVPAESAAHVVESVHGAPVYRLRGQLLPLVYLSQILQLSSAARADGRVNIVVLQIGGRLFGLVVDEVINTQEIVVKPMGRSMQGIPAFAGATIMGDGTVALILDVTGLSRQAGLPPVQTADQAADEPDTPSVPRRPVVVCEVDDGRRIAIGLRDVERLEEFPVDRLERAAGQAVVQYGGEIMPLIDMSTLWGKQRPAATTDTVRVVVGRGGSGSVGLVVSRILDIVECPPGRAVSGAERGVTESVVIAERVTDVIDWNAVWRTAMIPVAAPAGGETS